MKQQEKLFQFTHGGYPTSWKIMAAEQHFFTPRKLTEGVKKAIGIRV